MKNVLLVASIAALIISPAAVLAQGTKWIRQFGTPTGELVKGVAVGEKQRLYVAGEVNGGTLPGQTSAGGRDVFIRKYKANGEEVWTRQFGSSGNDFVGSVSGGLALGDESVYVVGRTTGTLPGQASAGDVDAFIRKYDTEGNVVWTRQFGTSSFDDLHDVAVDADGRIYVAGSTTGMLPGQSSSGGFDAFVQKYAADGTVLWTRQFGTDVRDHLDAIAVDEDGGVYTAGFTDGTFPGQTSAGSTDVLVRKYDANGTVLWTRQFGTPAIDAALGIAAEDDVGVYVDGLTFGTLPGQTSTGGEDIFLRKYGLNGSELWTRQFGTSGLDEPSVVAIADGFVFLDGIVSGALPGQTSAGDIDAFVRKYDTFGFEVWTLQFGTAGVDDPRGMAVDHKRVFVGGLTTGTLPGQAPNAGLTDAFVMRLIDEDGSEDGEDEDTD